MAAVIAAAVVVAGGLAFGVLTWGNLFTIASQNPQASPTTFVGSETCAGCHKGEADHWRGSQHAHAMQHATEQSVLGDFSDASFDYYGVHSRFFRQDGKFLVETDGPDGKLAIFEVKYTFGLDPLQQYLVEFPDGRLQALSLAWDTRPKDKGGQRWFHLYPNEAIRHDDPLHWTKLNQNWNFMCAECHSTGVRKNYDAANDGFATHFAEIHVGCEACHGQGSRHVDWAHQQQSWWPFGKPEDRTKGLPVSFDERDGITWLPDPRTGKPQRRIGPAILRKEVETCGLCHARRGEFSEDWVPGRWLSDTHVVSPLARGLYHADGQMQDEVYNYGSFKQSRMFAAGVTCSDCHDPHSAKLVASGDSVCTQCHATDTYASARHTHHAHVKDPIGCASCHMQARTYMVIDQRHDHSFRVPRPDLSAKLGTPNACNDCHADKTAQWAAAAIDGWFGPDRKGFQNYAEAFHAAWSDGGDAAAMLAAVASGGAPAFARASALSELATRVSRQNVELAQAALKDPDPMVRIGALDMLANVPPTHQLWTLVAPLLSDPIRGVRIGTGRCWPRFRLPVSRPLTAYRSRTRRPSSLPPIASMPIGQSRVRRWEAFLPGADSAPTQRPSTRPRCGSVRSSPPRRSTSPSSTAASGATPMARPCCARRSPRPPRMLVRCTRWGSPWYGSNDPMRRSTCCAARQRPSPSARDTPMCTRSG